MGVEKHGAVLKTNGGSEMDTDAAEAIARVCHEVNRAFCAAMGDDSQVPWEEAPDWQRESAIKGVLFNVENRDTTNAGDTHRSWLAEKEATGWKYGPVKDVEKKEHPCMVPFHELPPEQQVKDHLFLAISLGLSK